jgi:hypothetical protein
MSLCLNVTYIYGPPTHKHHDGLPTHIYGPPLTSFTMGPPLTYKGPPLTYMGPHSQPSRWAPHSHIRAPHSHAYHVQTEIAKRSGVQVTGCGRTVYQLQDMRSADGKKYEVDLENLDCCDYVHTHQLPCRHMVPVFHSRSMMSSPRKVQQCIAKFWPKWALASEYIKIYEPRAIHIPPVYSGPFVGPDEQRLKPPIQKHRKRGRPKKERYRWTSWQNTCTFFFSFFCTTSIKFFSLHCTT